MKIMICDDQKEYVDDLLRRCRAYAEEHQLDADICGTTEPEVVFQDIPDLLILDIEMPNAGMSGIAVKNRLAVEDRPLILFATSYPENMPEAFGRNVIGFMVKPIQDSQFQKLMDSAIILLTMDIMVDFEDGSMASTKDIIKITVEKGYAQVHLSNGEPKSYIRKSLKIWEEDLGEYGFIRINESCLLNCRFIRNFDGNNVILKNGETLKASRRRREDCFKKFMSYSKKTARYA